MKRQNEFPDFDEAIASIRNSDPDSREMRAAGDRVWQRIQAAYADPQFSTAAETLRACQQFRELMPASEAGTLSPGKALLLEDHLRECVACRHYAKGISDTDAAHWTPAYQAASFTQWNWRRASMYVAIFVAAVLGGWTLNTVYFAVPAGSRAKVEEVNGTLYRVADNREEPVNVGSEINEGQLLRTAAGSHAFVRLSDGSRVEMNERVEFSVSARRNDTTVHLGRGNIIVEAAKRTKGHLYVSAPDCKVAVTGTVFSVNSGLKGSRVAVIEGAVHVAHAGNDSTLHPGDEVSTTSDMGTVPIKEEISWSQNLDKHLALLAEFANLNKKFESVSVPPPRYQSALLKMVPANTVVYASIPNLGETLAEANRIFQDQLQQSPVLQQWWSDAQRGSSGPTPEQVIETVRSLSEYLGDEVVFVGMQSPPTHAVLARIEKPGLREFLETQVAALGVKQGDIEIYDAQTLPASDAGLSHHGPVFLITPDTLIISCDIKSIRQLSNQIGHDSGFESTPFGQKIQQVYGRGAGILVAANLKALQAHNSPQGAKAASATGFSDADYLVAEHREENGQPENRAVLAFSNTRRGIASWLSAPAPIGSLNFVSSNASAALAMVVKSPAQMLQDVATIQRLTRSERRTTAAHQGPPKEIVDLAAGFGNDFAVALDGPVLPTPSWKLVAEVYDSNRVQYAMQELVARYNEQEAKEGKPSLKIASSTLNGQTYYAVVGGPTEVHYTFADGYMIMAPSRALLTNALTIHDGGATLATSDQFRSLLPQDPRSGASPDYSAVLYQNLSPVLEPLAGVLTDTQLQSLQRIAADSRPTVVAAWGGQDRIEVLSNSRFVIDLNTLTLGALLGTPNNPGTRR